MTGPEERSPEPEPDTEPAPRAPDGWVNRPRALAVAAGVLCLATGAAFGWTAAVQTYRAGVAAAVAPVPASPADNGAAARAAVQAEGWSQSANAAYALAKWQNVQAQTARKQARESAVRAERAAARAAAIEAKLSAARAAPPAAAPAGAPEPAPTPAAHPPRRVSAAKRPAPAAPASPLADESCRRATIYERTAANASLSRQAAYNAVRSGIAVNAHCPEPARSLIGAYLLAQRASAESGLKIGDWQSDLSQSDRVLAACVKHPERYGTASTGCRQRLTKNARFRQAAQRVER